MGSEWGLASFWREKGRDAAKLLLALVLVFSLVPGAAYAEQNVSASASGPNASTDDPSAADESERVVASLSAKAMVAGKSGWRAAVGSKLGGSSGSAALTAVRFSLESSMGGSISYRVYRSGKGWSPLTKDGVAAGAKKRAQAVQAVRLKLTGAVSESYGIYYRANVIGYGWTDWGHDGQSVGAAKLADVRGLQIKLVKKGTKAPGETTHRYFVKGAKSAETFYARHGKTRDQLIKAVGKAKGSGLKAFGGNYDFNSKAGKKLKKVLKGFSRYRLSFVMIDLNSGRGIAYNPGKVQYIASSIKGPYVAAVNKYRSSSVSAGVRATMGNTIRVSSNEGYASLRRRFGHGIMRKMMGYCGIGAKEMAWTRNYPYMSSRTLAKLWIGTYWYYYRETNGRSAWARNLYAHPLNSFIDRALDTPTRTKPGWYPGGGYNVQNDAGVVLVDGHPYVLAVMSSACGQYAKLAELVRAIDGVHADMVEKR